MIIQSLSPVTLGKLHKNGWARLKRGSGETYTITFAKGKYFRLTKYLPGFDRKSNKTAKISVQIFDVFSFFMCSFIKAYEQLIGPVSKNITEGKAGRQQFSIEDFDDILTYWTEEIQLLKLLADELRRRFKSAGFNITEWYGPGALASYALRQHNIKNHMAIAPPEVREAARFAYAGGHFERFKLGRIPGPIWGVDINSAYPYAISLLPSMSEGTWEHVEKPTKIEWFGVYRISLRDGRPFDRRPSPVFHRDKQHLISFPWTVDGWYWSPEVKQACLAAYPIIHEGWVFRPSTSIKPYHWIIDMYAQRLEWKELGISAQLALKLCMNSIYGKLAQRVGWDPVKQRIPPFHQLEQAGWVTSFTRARLYEVIRRIPYDDLIAVETDGIYTTCPPAQLGIEKSTELGGWSIKEYKEAMYVQSGLAWLQDTSLSWEDKRRGLDGCKSGHTPAQCNCQSVFSLGRCQDYLQSLHSNPTGTNPWRSYVGTTTRFIGLGQALQSLHTQQRHCVWETRPREIDPDHGKRMHYPPDCTACNNGKNAFEQAHDMVIRSKSLLDPYSYPHDIPWETDEIAPWREYEEDSLPYFS
jgi:hypothetical protein